MHRPCNRRLPPCVKPMREARLLGLGSGFWTALPRAVRRRPPPHSCNRGDWGAHYRDGAVSQSTVMLISSARPRAAPNVLLNTDIRRAPKLALTQHRSVRSCAWVRQLASGRPRRAAWRAAKFWSCSSTARCGGGSQRVNPWTCIAVALYSGLHARNAIAGQVSC